MSWDPPLQADPVNRTFLLGTIRTLSFGGDRHRRPLARPYSELLPFLLMPSGAVDLRDFATRYTAAWCSQNPANVAAFFSDEGSLSTTALQRSEGVPLPRWLARSWPLFQTSRSSWMRCRSGAMTSSTPVWPRSMTALLICCFGPPRWRGTKFKPHVSIAYSHWLEWPPNQTAKNGCLFPDVHKIGIFEPATSSGLQSSS